MNKSLQTILEIIQRDESLTAEQKQAALKSLKDADKELEVTAFKLDRTEKVKHTIAVLLEETIAELEEKRKSVEAQNRELQIESSLERVRAHAMIMSKPADLLDICKSIYKELSILDFPDLRNAMINIHDDAHASLSNYDYSDSAGPTTTTILYNSHPATENLVKQIQSSTDAFAEFAIAGKELDEWRAYRITMGEKDDPRLNNTDVLSYYFYSIGTGSIGISTYKPIAEEKRMLLRRFRNVFDLAYRRYLDITQAAAQAREAQIEASMERVRSSTMAMHKSEQLAEVAVLFYKELMSLGVTPFFGCGYVEVNEAEMLQHNWMTMADGTFLGEFSLPLTGEPVFDSRYESWKQRVPVFHQVVGGDQLKRHVEFARSHMGLKEVEESVSWQFPDPTIFYCGNFSHGYLHIITAEKLSIEAESLLARFTRVFEMTYKRFLDLQKSEAQTREAQIELALERVRARAMAMHSSNELSQLVATLFEELVKLDLVLKRCIIWIFDAASLSARIWMANSEDKKNAESYYIQRLHHPYYEELLTQWKEKTPKWIFDLKGAFKESLDKLLLEETELSRLPEVVKNGLRGSRRTSISGSFHSFGFIEASGPIAYSEEQLEILHRFGKVFDQNYMRFLDLQKAEAQAREAQIEASLERVRSKAMAMHSSEDLASTVDNFFTELKSLQVLPHRCGVSLISGETRIADLAVTTATPDGETKMITGLLKLSGHPVLNAAFEHWVSQEEFHPVLHGREIAEYYKVMNPQVEMPAFADDEIQYGHYFSFKEGYVFAWSNKDLPENVLRIFRRFTSVISLTYRRYKDLKEAETQAREATIEASLEKVRGKAMAMRNSDDLSSTASMVFTELRKLGINPVRCGVGIITKESRRLQFYSATSSTDKDSLSLKGGLIMSGHPEFERQYDFWIRQENYSTILEGDELQSYNQFLSTGLSADTDFKVQGAEPQYGYWLMFSEGFLFAWSKAAYSDSEINILDRFKNIVELTFRRYFELRLTEANALEAVRQASLDRVRAEIASMRSTNDLERITPLMWSELNTLGIPFVRCGVFIMDDAQKLIHTFLSTPDGKAILSFRVPYATPGRISDILGHWQNKQNYLSHWDEVAFNEFADTLISIGVIPSKEQYMKTVPHGGIHLHCLPFLQGMLYVGNTSLLQEDEISLVQSLADAFSTAYARYEDFNKLEYAKAQIEKTLTDLKQTQAQLVQSEKMASLGELTAGIAHEIQNPLNFVNNFSEVSNELIDEMMEEVKKGNLADAKVLAEDVKANLEKILHHGKRADGIVKGMLQHSRASSGTKEPTDINSLADEYLRLAYHGLRAKDKSFNAKFESSFDETIGKINVIPQDIGRVVLNLITNAFYAVTEKRNQNGKTNYEPTVLVTTKKLGNQILVSVKDNGNGVPQKALDKIFQPFFTTKPTGQGTGLGLSLSYDIVKAHGGELKVKTKEGDGAEFIMLLPA